MGACERMVPCRTVRIWGLGEYRRHKPACSCAVCPSMEAPATSASSKQKNQTQLSRRRQCQDLIDSRGSPL